MLGNSALAQLALAQLPQANSTSTSTTSCFVQTNAFQVNAFQPCSSTAVGTCFVQVNAFQINAFQPCSGTTVTTCVDAFQIVGFQNDAFQICGAAAAASPAWRRWLAQTYPGAVLNRVPDNALVRDIISHMLTEARALFPEMPRSDDALLQFVPRDERIDVRVIEAETEEEREAAIARMVEDAMQRFPELFAAPLKDQDDRPLRIIVDYGEDGRPVIVELPEPTIEELVAATAGMLKDSQSLVVTLPIEGDDSDEELEAILMAAMH